MEVENSLLRGFATAVQKVDAIRTEPILHSSGDHLGKMSACGQIVVEHKLVSAAQVGMDQERCSHGRVTMGALVIVCSAAPWLRPRRGCAANATCAGHATFPGRQNRRSK
jgi:hypothetical protein